MTGDHSLSAVADDDERLARFVLFSRWIRANQTAKPDAFIPHPYPDLSVTRHTGLSEDELWETGQAVASARPATLYGRADVYAQTVQRQHLEIHPDPVKNNCNHANIVGWPNDKPAQKIIALALAAGSTYIPKV